MLTFRREDQLADAIEQLVLHLADFNSAHVGLAHSQILVIDNDPGASARDIVRRFVGDGVDYRHEPEPGISAGRNRAIAESQSDDLLVFIDDDERPLPGWLTALYRCWLNYGRPAAVAGPVLSVFETPIDPWVAQSRVYERLHVANLSTGDHLERAATNNLLLSLEEVQKLEVRFDPAYGLTGGGDTMFTESLTRSGGRLVWCREAVVTELVPPERRTREYVLRRTYSLSNVSVRAEIELDGETLPRLALVRLREGAKGCTRLMVGGLLWLAGIGSGSHLLRVKGEVAVARARGALAASAGNKYFEYRRP